MSTVRWRFFKTQGRWGYSAVSNGHTLEVGPGLSHRWVAAVDGRRIGTASTDSDARKLAEKVAGHD